jgi:hypothetical protein
MVDNSSAALIGARSEAITDVPPQMTKTVRRGEL